LDINRYHTMQENKDTQCGRYLLFSIGNEDYGIEILFVTEILSTQAIKPLPDMPDYMKGVIGLRGKTIPVIDMRLRFTKQAEKDTEKTCIVVINAKAYCAGLIVDEVKEVLEIEEKDIAMPPMFEPGESSRYISGIGKVGDQVKLIINCERLFTDKEAKQIQDIQAE